jgi:hypothetical protein
VDIARIDLWNEGSGETASAVFRLEWDGVSARLSMDAAELGLSVQADGQDLFGALQHLRKRDLEPLGWVPLCNGARVDCYPSGMARDMGGGMDVYVLSARRWLGLRHPLVGTFEPAPKESVGTVEDQDARFERFFRSRRR